MTNPNILKVRDDHVPVYFDEKSDSEFLLQDGVVQPSWLSDNVFTINELRSRIEPWLTSLFQSEHLSLLVGSGLTTAIQYLATETAGNGMGSPSLRTELCKKN